MSDDDLSWYSYAVERRAKAVAAWLRRRRPLVVGLGVALISVVLLVLLVWILPAVLTRGPYTEWADRMKAQSDVRGNLITLVGAFGLLGGLTYTARTFQLNQSGQITDRYSKAVEHLGDPKSDIRLGGIYALERIAKDSGRDHPTVVQVLSAFVREQTRPRTTEDTSEPPSASTPKSPPTVDVQAALTVLGGLPQRRGVERAYLEGAMLAGVDLRGAHLNGANLTGADLRGAHLSGASLAGADLSGAHMEGAVLNRVNLTGATLVSTDLRNARLEAAHLDAADMLDVHLEGASLSDAHLERANLKLAHLMRAVLKGANLAGADMPVADMSLVLLEGANLAGANLAHANVRGANLDGANVRGANLTGVDMKSAYVGSATGLESAKGLKPPTGVELS